MTAALVLLLIHMALLPSPQPPQSVDPAEVILSVHADGDFALTADPTDPAWRDVPYVEIGRTYDGGALAGRPTQVRSRWTTRHLYLLYACPYDTLTLRPELDLSAETPQLWNWDVAEAFIGSDFDRIGFYKEFQVSPRGEWVDLAIDRDSPATQEGMRWDSGFVVKARIDEAARVWYGEMQIPFASLDVDTPAPGRELRIGLFRLSGAEPRVLHLWRPTGQPSFHVPRAFGLLRLIQP